MEGRNVLFIVIWHQNTLSDTYTDFSFKNFVCYQQLAKYRIILTSSLGNEGIRESCSQYKDTELCLSTNLPCICASYSCVNPTQTKTAPPDLPLQVQCWTSLITGGVELQHFLQAMYRPPHKLAKPSRTPRNTDKKLRSSLSRFNPMINNPDTTITAVWLWTSKTCMLRCVIQIRSISLVHEQGVIIKPNDHCSGSCDGWCGFRRCWLQCNWARVRCHRLQRHTVVGASLPIWVTWVDIANHNGDGCAKGKHAAGLFLMLFPELQMWSPSGGFFKY